MEQNTYRPPRSSSFSPPQKERDTYGSPVAPVYEEPRSLKSSPSPPRLSYRKTTTSAPAYNLPSTEKEDQAPYDFNFPSFGSYFDVEALEESFGTSYGGSNPSQPPSTTNKYREQTTTNNYREPIRPVNSEQPTFPTFATPTTTATPRYRSTTPAPTYAKPSTPKIEVEFTPGPIYYKPLPTENTYEAPEIKYTEIEEEEEEGPYTFFKPAPASPIPQVKEDPLPSYPKEPPTSQVFYDNAPSIYDDIEEEDLGDDYGFSSPGFSAPSFSANGFSAPGSQQQQQQLPKRKSFKDFTSYDEESADEGELSTGFYSSPSFKSGLMTPDVWEMQFENSDWGQKVQS